MDKAAGEMMLELAQKHAETVKQSMVHGDASDPSAPGQIPHTVSGKLRDSIHAEKSGPTSARSVADAPHATALEFGTSKIAERPYMRPALKQMKKDVKGIAATKVRRVTQG